MNNCKNILKGKKKASILVTFGIMQPWRILGSSSNCNVKNGHKHSSILEVNPKFHGFNSNSIQGIKQEPITFLFNLKHIIAQFFFKYAPHPMQWPKSTH
jgi:hypothetical protein